MNCLCEIILQKGCHTQFNQKQLHVKQQKVTIEFCSCHICVCLHVNCNKVVHVKGDIFYIYTYIFIPKDVYPYYIIHICCEQTMSVYERNSQYRGKNQ